MSKKAIALISGGLDSVLAARVVIEQGFTVMGLYCSSAFSKSFGNEEATPAARVANSIGIELRVLDMGQDYIDMIRNPKNGYGRHINPCIDCKIFMLTKAKEIMREQEALFIITGEVLGQRPMSQRRDTLHLIERDAGLKGMVLRPLSAKHLPPTVAEEEGSVDRGKLLDISGRSRNVQLHLAGQYGITGFSAPAGGCLLTEEYFAEKLRDLFTHSPSVTPADIQLLTVGRHFRLESGKKAILGRDNRENTTILSLEGPGFHLFLPHDFPGPVAIITGKPSDAEKHAVGGLMLKFSKEIPGRTRTIRYGAEIFAPEEGAEEHASRSIKVGSGP